MEWERSTIKRWSGNGYRITEEPGATDGQKFRLDLPDPDASPLFFAGLDAAKGHAGLLNQLELFRTDNAQLRADLAQARGVWPAPLEDDDAVAAQAYEALMGKDDDNGTGAAPDPWFDGDGRGIPLKLTGPVNGRGHG